MHNAGVTVALNSDNSELSRRLNLEAAKAVKYGGVSQEEAWKFVTLNPAKLLRLDDKVEVSKLERMQILFCGVDILCHFIQKQSRPTLKVLYTLIKMSI